METNYTPEQERLVFVAWRCKQRFSERAKEIGLRPVAALDDELYLGIYGQYGFGGFLHDIMNSTEEAIKDFTNKQISALEDLKEKTRETLLKQQAEIQQKLNDLDR